VRILIIGCGYVGMALGAELARRGHNVFGLRRGGSEMQANGIVPLIGDVTQPESLSQLPSSYDWVVNAVSSSKGGLSEYHAVYLEGTRNVLQWLAPMTKYVFLSSTSVYAQNDGSWVDEQSAAEGASETSKVLVATEKFLMDRARRDGIPAVILRPSGIYGPGRGYLFQQFLRGEATIDGCGERIINMIHRDDLASAIIAALERGRVGEIYNASDDQPVTQLEFFQWFSEQLRKPMPPLRTDAEAAPRKRGITNKRVSNQKLKAVLGHILKFPTFREGYSDEICPTNDGK
jgi:nucleoside-diphosphate-sugar epimerase